MSFNCICREIQTNLFLFLLPFPYSLSISSNSSRSVSIFFAQFPSLSFLFVSLPPKYGNFASYALIQVPHVFFCSPLIFITFSSFNTFHLNVYIMSGCRVTGNVYIIMGNYLRMQRFFDSDDLSQPGVSVIPYRLMYACFFLYSTPYGNHTLDTGSKSVS